MAKKTKKTRRKRRRIFRWQAATNFYLAGKNEQERLACWRYGAIAEELERKKGVISAEEGMKLLERVAIGNTQWSIVYDITAGEVQVVLDSKFDKVHTFELEMQRAQLPVLLTFE